MASIQQTTSNSNETTKVGEAGPTIVNSAPSSSPPEEKKEEGNQLPQAPWYEQDEDGFPKPVPRGQSEQEQAAWYEWISFSWVSRMMLVGDSRDKKHQQMELKDLAQLPEWEQPAVTRERFKEFWDEGPLKPENRAPDEELSLLRALFRFQKSNLFKGAICRFLADALSIANFYILREFIRYLTDSSLPAWQGWPWITALFFSNAGSFFFNNLHFIFNHAAFEQMRGVCQLLVFDASLSMPADHQLTGQLTTAHGSDVKSLVDMAQYVQYLWSSPIFFIACVVSLGVFIGWAGAVVSLISVVSFVVQAVATKKSGVYRIETLERVDKRASLLNELFQGIKIVKFMNWQDEFVRKIIAARDYELDSLGTSRLFVNFGFSFAIGATFVLYVAAFAIAVKGFEVQLTAVDIFPAVLVLRSIRFPLLFTGLAGTKFAEVKAALERIQSCVVGHERYDFLEKCFDGDEKTSDLAAEMKNVTVLSEPDSKEVVARNLSVNIHKGKLTIILGRTASGKTTLLNALTAECAGDLHYDASQEKGFLRHYQRAALIPQEKFIKNATIKENIVMCEEFDEKRYKEALRVSQLEPDLKELTHADNTEVGAKGVTLSGGQCSRLQIARAVYSNRDFVIADDPLSAVDPHVANSLVNEVFCGPAMKGKTVLLVTHMKQLASKADRIIYMEDCEIDFDGTVEEFKDLGYDVEEIAQELAEEEQSSGSFRQQQRSSGGSFSTSPARAMQIGNGAADDGDTLSKGRSRNLSPGHSKTLTPGHSSFVSNNSPSRSSFRGGESSTRRRSSASPKDNDILRGVTQLMSAEDRATGSVSLDTYWFYIQKSGVFWFVSSFFLSILGEASFGAVNLVLAGVAAPKDGLFAVFENFTADDYIFWMGIFILIGSSLVLTRIFTFFKTNVNVSRETQVGMVQNLVRAPMSFFDTTPVGRIINRCLLDQLSIDVPCADNILFSTSSFATLVATIAITIISTWYIAIIIPFIVMYYVLTYLRYAGAARGLKRLENTSRSPMMAIMNEVCGGLASIRTYGLEKELSKEHVKRTALSQQSLYAARISQRWLQSRTDFIGSLLVFCVGGLAVLARHFDSDALPMTPALTAIALANALSTTISFSFLTKYFSDLECEMSSLEAISEYTYDIAQEATLEYDDEKNKAPAENWPAENPSVEFKDVCLRYRPGLPLVLKKVSFSIKPFTRSALVGRSGSSKSTALLALFRIVEIESGSILVDDRDITRTLDTRNWRSRITIIPQDPLLFTGTIRQNLDPFGQFSDDQLWAVIDRLQLRERLEHIQQQQEEEESSTRREPTATAAAVEMKEEKEDKQQPKSLGLQTIVQEKGQNFSLGERQLWCLCRCLLKKTPIVLLDEATASVDSDTDQLIQRVIRTEFKDCTIITIAHRIGTIIDSDQIIVMNNGEVEEDGHPADLLKNENGAFRLLCSKLGSAQLEKLQKIAEGKESVADAAAQLANVSLED